MKDKLVSNKGSGLGVILYGVTLLLALIFAAINFVNSKVIESGYNSLRDAVQAASSGSVMHLLTTQREGTSAVQSTVIKNSGYDIYLQLALGYLINRSTDVNNTSDTEIQSGDLNNFMKLDHQKVVNSTLALLEGSVHRVYKKNENGDRFLVPIINNTEKYKVIMFFIEPYESNGKKYFDIIAYGNGDYDTANHTITKTLVPNGIVAIEGATIKDVDSNKVVEVSGNTMESTYKNIQSTINAIVNTNYKINQDGDSFNINLNAHGDLDGLVREMQTSPHYLIVVKDFALPTIFDGEDTNSFKKFFSISGDGSLKNPMCALNTGKIQRHLQTEEEKNEGRWSDSIR